MENIITVILGIVFITVVILSGTWTNNSTLFAAPERAISNSGVYTFHAQGMIGTIISHLLAQSISSSLGVANSSNLLSSTYLPGSVSKSSSAPITTTTNTTTKVLPTNETNNTAPTVKSLFAQSLTNPNILLPKIYIADGDWKVDVINGKVQNLIANFTEVLNTGNNPHTHTITNFRGINNSLVSLSSDKSVGFSGNADIMKNGRVIWSNVPIKVFIAKGYAISISVDPTKSGNHFRGIPIFGTVTTLTGQNGNELRPTVSEVAGNNTM
jgi:hypothetical protein